MNSLPIQRFFDAWDDLEAAHPFGVMAFAPLFMEFGVTQALAFDVDECLFLDLMSPRLHAVRRIKVEARVSQAVFWVYVDMDAQLVSFQSSPLAPFAWSTPIDPSLPAELVRIIFHYHRSSERGRVSSMRCFPNALLTTASIRRRGRRQ